MMRLVAVLLLLGACAYRETNPEPIGPPIEVVEPQYLVVRPMQDGTPADPLVNLSHFDMRTAEVIASESGAEHSVTLETTPAGSEILGNWTAANIGKQLGIYLDGTLISTPIIATRLDMVLIRAGSKEQAVEIVARMRRGGKR